MPISISEVAGTFWANLWRARARMELTESPLIRELERRGPQPSPPLRVGDLVSYETTAPVIFNVETRNPRLLGVVSSGDIALDMRVDRDVPADSPYEQINRSMRESIEAERQRMERQIYTGATGGGQPMASQPIEAPLHYPTLDSAGHGAIAVSAPVRADGPDLSSAQLAALEALDWFCDPSGLRRGQGRSTVAALYLIRQALQGKTMPITDFSTTLVRRERVETNGQTAADDRFRRCVLLPMIDKYYANRGLEVCATQNTITCPRARLTNYPEPVYSLGSVRTAEQYRSGRLRELLADEPATCLGLDHSTAHWWRQSERPASTAPGSTVGERLAVQDGDGAQPVEYMANVTASPTGAPPVPYDVRHLTERPITALPGRAVRSRSTPSRLRAAAERLRADGANAPRDSHGNAYLSPEDVRALLAREDAANVATVLPPSAACETAEALAVEATDEPSQS